MRQTNAEKLEDFINVSVATLECDYCNDKKHYNDEYELARVADEEGWRITRTNKVKCPKCIRKSKRPMK